MDIAAITNATQRPPTAIEVRPAPSDRGRPNPDASAGEAPSGAKPERSFWQQAFGDDGFSFGTLLDIINPLQHIPVVSTIYQKLTGDETSPGANIIGGALFGGPIGLMVAAADSALKIETGKDTGGHVFALFDSEKPDTDIPATDVANADTKAGEATETAAEASESSASRESEKADTPTLVPPTAATASVDDAAIPAAHPVASAVPRSAFVLANSARHTQGHGIGGAFVPFETRSTIAPPSLFTSASFGGFAAPAETAAPKRADKAAAPAVPDLKSLAANPEQMKKLRVNGMRPVPTAKPVPLESRAFPAGPQLPPLAGGSSPIAPMGKGLDSGNGDGFADLMARNIERYMSLKNKRPAPSHINQSF